MKALLTVGIDKECLESIKESVADRYEVTSVALGQEALEVLATDAHFDVLMAESELDDQSGVAFCGEVRKRFKNSELPIVFVG